MSARDKAFNAQTREGWTDYTLLTLLLEFIDVSGLEDSMAEFLAERSYYKPKVTCPRCGGPWGFDITCVNCTDYKGNPRPIEETA